MAHAYVAKTALGRVVNEIEETAIAVILGLMTVITFINVVLRYGFNTGLIWGLEAVTFLFAWLVLFGVSYTVKVTAQLGVDAVINLFAAPGRKVFALIAGLICIAYAGLVLKGAWDYWAPFANLDATSGHWFPTGFEKTRDQGWYEVIDIPFPQWLSWIEPFMNDGDAYEKLPRFIPYFMLPFGMALLLFRFIQAFIRVWRNEATSLIVSHEAEDDIKDVQHLNAGD